MKADLYLLYKTDRPDENCPLLVCPVTGVSELDSQNHESNDRFVEGDATGRTPSFSGHVTSQQGLFFPSDLELDRQPPAQPTGGSLSFSLSFLVFLITYMAVFFAIWRISEVAAILGVVFSTPVWIRVYLIYDQHNLRGRPLTLGEKIATVANSVGVVIASTLCFAISFSLLLGSIVFVAYWIGGIAHGAEGQTEGAVLGTLSGLLIGGAGAIFLTAWLVQKIWPSRILDSMSTKNENDEIQGCGHRS